MSDHGLPAEPRLASINRQQLVLRSIDVEQLIDEGHSARLIWELIGRLDLSLYYAHIEAVKGRAGPEHTDPQLLISLWIYAYSRGLSSARELARQCEYEPGCQWLWIAGDQPPDACQQILGDRLGGRSIGRGGAARERESGAEQTAALDMQTRV